MQRGLPHCEPQAPPGGSGHPAVARATVHGGWREQDLGREDGRKPNKWKFCPGLGELLGLPAPGLKSGTGAVSAPQIGGERSVLMRMCGECYSFFFPHELFLKLCVSIFDRLYF